MKVLLTGSSGFVGSHILDELRAKAVSVAVLLRPTSDRSFLRRHLPEVECRAGSINNPALLDAALNGVTHVIHCAGCTKAVRVKEFYQVNQIGTRNVVEAVNRRCDGVRRLLHVSSLAAAGPATVEKPAQEDDPPHPVSEYGKSKLAAESEVRDNCRTDHVIVRPPAVYGPRDQGFFSLFQSVARHLRPLPSERQALSLVYVKDLAATIVQCLEHPAAAGRTYFVAAREVVTAREMARQIAAQMKHWTIPVPLPSAALWPVCLAQGVWSRITGRPSLLTLAKFPELRAEGWVCDPGRLERELGFCCRTSLEQGVAETLDWYRENQWLSFR